MLKTLDYVQFALFSVHSCVVLPKVCSVFLTSDAQSFMRSSCLWSPESVPMSSLYCPRASTAAQDSHYGGYQQHGRSHTALYPT